MTRRIPLVRTTSRQPTLPVVEGAFAAMDMLDENTPPHNLGGSVHERAVTVQLQLDTTKYRNWVGSNYGSKAGKKRVYKKKWTPRKAYKRPYKRPYKRYAYKRSYKRTPYRRYRRY